MKRQHLLRLPGFSSEEESLVTAQQVPFPGTGASVFLARLALGGLLLFSVSFSSGKRLGSAYAGGGKHS